MAKYISKNVGGKIVKAIGLSGVKDFSLHFPMHGIPTIKCEMILSESQNEAIASVLESEGVTAGKPQGGHIPPGSGPYFVGEGPQASILKDARPAITDALKKMEDGVKDMNAAIEKRAIAAVQNERRRGGSVPVERQGIFQALGLLFKWMGRNPPK